MKYEEKMNLTLEDKIIYRGDIQIVVPQNYMEDETPHNIYIKPGDSLELWRFLSYATEMCSLKMLMGAVAREYREAGKVFNAKDSQVHKDVSLMKERVCKLLDEYSSQLNIDDSKALIKFYTNAIFNEYRHNYFEKIRTSFTEADKSRMSFLQNNVVLSSENRTERSCALYLVKSLLKKEGVGKFKELSVNDYEKLLKGKLEVLKVLDDLSLLHETLFSDSKEYADPNLKSNYAATIMPDIMNKINQDGIIYEKPIKDFETKELIVAFECWESNDKEKKVVDAMMGYFKKAHYRTIHNDLMTLINHCKKSKVLKHIDNIEKKVLTSALINRVEISEDNSARCNVFFNFEPLLMMQELSVSYFVKQIEVDLLNSLESNSGEIIKKQVFQPNQNALSLRDMFFINENGKNKNNDITRSRILERFKDWKGHIFELLKNELENLDSDFTISYLKRELKVNYEDNQNDFFGVKINVSQSFLPVVKLLINTLTSQGSEKEFNEFVKIKITEQAMKNDVEEHSLKVGRAKVRKF